MRVTIFGSGYVGLVTGACLAESGNNVLCVDIDSQKIDRLNSGEIPIYEPGLDKIIRSANEAGRLNFTTDVATGVAHGLFQFIAVGTPPDETGTADLQYVLDVARSIGEHLTDYRIIVNKSTVPVGTADRVQAEIQASLDDRGLHAEFDVVSNPEFLKEGAAIEDVLDAVGQRAGSNITSAVVKQYPTTTHAKTVEFRVSGEGALDKLYDSVRNAWINGKGRKFTIKTDN